MIKNDFMELEATEWVHRGNRYVRRDALSISDPESWVRLWKDKFGTISGFPWEDVYGSTPTVEEIIRYGLVDMKGREF